MHHPDYERPLLVVWMCEACHGVLHRIQRATKVDLRKPPSWVGKED